MEILEEKNRIYEDLTPQIKELLRLNTQIQTSSSESARLKQEVEFLKTEHSEKDKIMV